MFLNIFKPLLWKHSLLLQISQKAGGGDNRVPKAFSSQMNKFLKATEFENLLFIYGGF
jgi:hypothetical protein